MFPSRLSHRDQRLLLAEDEMFPPASYTPINVYCWLRTKKFPPASYTPINVYCWLGTKKFPPASYTRSPLTGKHVDIKPNNITTQINSQELQVLVHTYFKIINQNLYQFMQYNQLQSGEVYFIFYLVQSTFCQGYIYKVYLIILYIYTCVFMRNLIPFYTYIYSPSPSASRAIKFIYC